MTTVAPTGSDSSISGEVPRHQRVLQECGPATGRISGINHLVLFTRDINEGVRFYRDILGLRVVRTVRFATSADGLRRAANHSSGGAVANAAEPSSVAVEMTVRQVFFEMGNGELFSLYESPAVAEKPAAPVSSVLWPSEISERCSQPREPQKMDHLSFDVPTHADVEWFREHLLAHGVAVSEISERRGANNMHRFISSFYFLDPSGNPLEIATFDAADGAWRSYDFSDWFMDEDPVPALLDGPSPDGDTLAPRWVHPSDE
ncbi:VOC family protein [Nocardia miyunensis]|uniref:VOC family protein n=1 Tax=Nocardia miyunensis TaxID=282684 RepID=UPI000A4F90EB|nr:VOC family protein [Nocardia miyunensis]